MRFANTKLCFTFCRLSGSGLRGKQLEQGNPDSPLLCHFHQFLWGDTKTFPSKLRDIISPACPWSALGSHPGWLCLEHLPRGTFRRHPDLMPEPSLRVTLNLEEQWRYSESLLDVQLPPAVSKTEPSHPAKESHLRQIQGNIRKKMYLVFVYSKHN